MPLRGPTPKPLRGSGAAALGVRRQMSIAELGSLGEFVSAVAVLVTLIYLALQTRQSRIAAQETAKFSGLQATHSMLDLYFDWRRTLFSDPDNIRIISKANEGGDLTSAEQLSLSLIFHDLFFAAAYSYASSVSGGSIHEQQGDVEYLVHILNENSSAIGEWRKIEHIVSRMGTDYVQIVNSKILPEDA